jgi:3-oxoisoapionate decarboxylase
MGSRGRTRALLLRTAKLLGSPVARCYLGSRGDREGDGGIYPHIEATVKVLKTVQSQAEQAGSSSRSRTMPVTCKPGNSST